jgi:hypothetical protein
MPGRSLQRVFAILTVLVLTGCGGGSAVAPPPGGGNAAAPGNVAVIGTDAPLGSVLAFKITFTGLTASDGATTVALISQPQEVEFARLNGLRTLLALQSVAAGTYTSITATLASPVISVLNTTTTPPSVQMTNGTLTQSSVTVQLNQPIVVTSNGLVGLHMDFRLHDSILVDGNGDITGSVNPVIRFRAVPPDAPDALIDELHGGVVSINAAAGSFVMQTSHGRNLTVQTNAQTQWEQGESIADLTTNSIVLVTGSLQRQSLVLLAEEVRILSDARFFLGGLITDVRPASGAASALDLLVRTEIPDLAGFEVGNIGTVALDGNERYLIHHFRLPVAPWLFNATSLLAGQRVTIGGALDNTTTPPTPDARRVMLHRQGFLGGWVPGSTNITGGNNGGFGFNASGLTGRLLGSGPVAVFTSDRTRFINLSGLGGLTGSNPIRLRVVGLLLEGPNGNPVIIAWAVEAL